MKKTLLALTAASALFATAAQAQSATYAIEPTHTFVTFEIDHFGTSTNRGRFDKKEGTVQFDRAGKTGKVDITIDVDSVTGQFTLMGKTHPVTLKATKFNCYQNPMLKREVCGGDFETSIKRSQWGASYGLNYGFADDMRLVIQVEAVKQ